MKKEAVVYDAILNAKPGQYLYRKNKKSLLFLVVDYGSASSVWVFNEISRVVKGLKSYSSGDLDMNDWCVSNHPPHRRRLPKAAILGQ